MYKTSAGWCTVYVRTITTVVVSNYIDSKGKTRVLFPKAATYFFYFYFFQSHIPTVSDLPVVVFVYEVRQITLKGSPISVIQNTYIQLYNHLHVIIQKGHMYRTYNRA